MTRSRKLLVISVQLFVLAMVIRQWCGEFKEEYPFSSVPMYAGLHVAGMPITVFDYSFLNGNNKEIRFKELLPNGKVDYFFSHEYLRETLFGLEQHGEIKLSSAVDLKIKKLIDLWLKNRTFGRTWDSFKGLRIYAYQWDAIDRSRFSKPDRVIKIYEQWH